MLLSAVLAVTPANKEVEEPGKIGGITLRARLFFCLGEILMIDLVGMTFAANRTKDTRKAN